MGVMFSTLGNQTIVSGGSGGAFYAFNNINNTPQQVLGGNTNRTSVTFHNPGTVDIFIAPASVISPPFGVPSGSLTPLAPTLTTLGGCFLVFGNGGTLVLTGECQRSFNAFARSGFSNPLTVMESNI